MDFDNDFSELRSLATFGLSIISDKASLMVKNEMSAVKLAFVRRELKASGVTDEEIEAARHDLGIQDCARPAGSKQE